MLNRILIAAVLSIAAGSVYGIWMVLDTPIQKFVVQGELSTQEQKQVDNLLAGLNAGGILSTSLGDISATLLHLPWARGVSVRRQWPHALVITLKRANPIARWGEHQYVSAAGELMALPDSYLGLPQFTVALDDPASTMGVYRLLEQVFVRENLRISELIQNGQGEWTVLVKNPGSHQTTKILLGAEQLNERAHRYLRLQRQVLVDAAQQVDYVDARYASGLAVRYQPSGEDTGAPGDAAAAAHQQLAGGTD